MTGRAPGQPEGQIPAPALSIDELIDRASWATSASSAWNRIGSIISPILVGYILSANISIAPIFVMFGIVSLAGLIVTWTLGVETKGQVLETLSA